MKCYPFGLKRIITNLVHYFKFVKLELLNVDNPSLRNNFEVTITTREREGHVDNNDLVNF